VDNRTRKEKLESIVSQGGYCYDISCSSCPLYKNSSCEVLVKENFTEEQHESMGVRKKMVLLANRQLMDFDIEEMLMEK
jgi:hypothetical protein